MVGGKVTPAEGFIYSNYLILLQLLKIGIPYETIMELEDDDIVHILGIHAALIERQQEEIQ